MKRIENPECLGTEKNRDARSRGRLQKDKLRRAGKSPIASAVLYKTNILNVMRKQTLSVASDSSFLYPKMFQLGRRTLF